MARVLGRAAAQLELARLRQTDVLSDLAVVLVERGLRHGERRRVPVVVSDTFTARCGRPPEAASGANPSRAIGLAPTLRKWVPAGRVPGVLKP